MSEGQVGAYGNPQYADYWTAECWGARIPQSDGDTQTMDVAFGDVNGMACWILCARIGQTKPMMWFPVIM